MSRKGSEKYESILRAAIRVFADVGYHSAQVSRIAKEAGVADGTIYLYFNNKVDILISVFRESMGVYVEALKLHLAEERGAKAKLRRLVDEHFKSLADDIELAIVTQIELRQADRTIREGIQPFLKAYLDVIDDLIEEGKTEGVFRRDIETHIARKMIFGTLDETVTSWVMGHKRRPLLNLADPIFDALFNGMRTCKDNNV
ncbi:MAG: TetR/AcrR family transcriptional regulator [Candidatus Carbobacillus altaicus]|uniref:Fatty acid degradation regulator YsiA, TetR family n=1 Tax=Candidatus Carbonibacillus altaicus TaxID=2163959 RepID=A0A2R6Y4H6_9BACL|nr:TetR/AcrR family transcriptional regulator [Candidatus Carbobacillus altaicus]PTQ57553.1 MAG: Fatty acid degradation regulator YsiA, TetR family [Candidatus Carbobacillus altaicus]